MRRMSTPDDATTGADHSELTAQLADGWTIHVRGGWWDDDGFCGGHHGGSRHFGRLPGTTVEELRTAMVEQRAEDEREAATPVETHVRLVRDGVDVTVIDERRLPAEDPASLLWPPIVTPSGVVLRWERTTTSIDRPDGRPVEAGEAPHHTDTTIQRAWIVRPDGVVDLLPFELGVGPIAVSPDGRLLLPSTDPLWWDGDDEPLTLLDLDGATEQLVVDGGPITPSRILSSIGEGFANAPEHGEFADTVGADLDSPHWTVRQARFDSDALTLRLSNDHRHPDATEWVVVEVPLRGLWAVRRVGTGEVPFDAPLPPL